MSPTALPGREKRIVQVLFVLVVFTFFAAERASALLNRSHAEADAVTAARAATGAAASSVALHR